MENEPWPETDTDVPSDFTITVENQNLRHIRSYAEYSHVGEFTQDIIYDTSRLEWSKSSSLGFPPIFGGSIKVPAVSLLALVNATAAQ